MRTTAGALCSAAAALAAARVPTVTAFSPVHVPTSSLIVPAHRIQNSALRNAAADGGSGDTDAKQEVKAAPLVSGSELEVMLTDWDEPLVVDAYATW